jgi:uncharacterized protein
VIFYLDTSSLVKLYVNESGSERVAEAVTAADSLTSSMLAYAEALATFARAGREARLTQKELTTILDAFERLAGLYPLGCKC